MICAAMLFVLQGCYRQSQQNPSVGVRVLQKAIRHSNIFNAAIAGANQKCGSGEALRLFSEMGDFLRKCTNLTNLHETSMRSLFAHA